MKTLFKIIRFPFFVLALIGAAFILVWQELWKWMEEYDEASKE